MPKHRRARGRWPLVAAAVAAVLVVGLVLGYVLSSDDGSDLTGAGAGAPPPDPKGPTGTFQLAWHDEFDGDSLNTKIWQPNRFGEHDGDAPFNPDDEAAWFSEDNVEVSDGNLVITLNEDERSLDGNDYPYSSGVVQAKEPYVLKPGTYTEARISVPECDGCWPAFWAIPFHQYPPEVDVFEFFNTDTDSQPEFNYHYEDRSTLGSTKYGNADTDYREGFHTYGVLWQDGRAIPYVDGVAYPSVAAGDVSSVPLMTILNFSVQADHEPDAGAQMKVDWVRSWKVKSGSSASSSG